MSELAIINGSILHIGIERVHRVVYPDDLSDDHWRMVAPVLGEAVDAVVLSRSVISPRVIQRHLLRVQDRQIAILFSPPAIVKESNAGLCGASGVFLAVRVQIERVKEQLQNVIASHAKNKGAQKP